MDRTANLLLELRELFSTDADTPTLVLIVVAFALYFVWLGRGHLLRLQ